MLKAKRSVDAMLAQSKQHVVSKSGSVTLKDGARYHQLVTIAGNKTKLGRYYEQKTGVDLPASSVATPRQSVDAMLDRGKQHSTSSSGAVIIKDGGKYHQLVSAAGEKTKLGTYFEQKAGIDLPSGGFDTSQAPYREGDTEYIAMRN